VIDAILWWCRPELRVAHDAHLLRFTDQKTFQSVTESNRNETKWNFNNLALVLQSRDDGWNMRALHL
jgi:hypothetical protein